MKAFCTGDHSLLCLLSVESDCQNQGCTGFSHATALLKLLENLHTFFSMLDHTTVIGDNVDFEQEVKKFLKTSFELLQLSS